MKKGRSLELILPASEVDHPLRTILGFSDRHRNAWADSIDITTKADVVVDQTTIPSLISPITVASLGDTNDDGKGDIAIGSPRSNSLQGSVNIVSKQSTWKPLSSYYAADFSSPLGLERDAEGFVDKSAINRDLSTSSTTNLWHLSKGPTSKGIQYQVDQPTFSNNASIVNSANKILDNTDDLAVQVALPFTFNFYGKSYTSLYVGSNGLITFDSANSSYVNTDLTANVSQAAIAPLWDDWITDLSTSDGAVYAARVDDANHPGFSNFVIRWQVLQHFSTAAVTSASAVTFEVVLSQYDQSVQFNYPDIDTGEAATTLAKQASIGIKSEGNANALRQLVSFNGVKDSAYANINIGNPQSIRFHSPADVTLPGHTSPNSLSSLPLSTGRRLGDEKLS